MLFSKYLDYSVKLNFILSYFDNLLLHKNVFLTLIWVNWFAHKLLSWLLFIMPTRSKTTHIVDKGIHGAITLNTNCTSIVTFIFRNNIITLYKAIQIWTQIHLFFLIMRAEKYIAYNVLQKCRIIWEIFLFIFVSTAKLITAIILLVLEKTKIQK